MRARSGRRWRRWLPVSGLALLLGAGCADRSRLSPPDALAKPQALAQSPRCDATRVGNVIGQRPTPELVQAARSDAGAIGVRTLAHDQPVASSDRAGQLDLVLDAEGRITSLSCG